MNIFIFTLSITGKNWRQFISQIVKHLISKTGNLNWVDLPRDIDRNSFGNNMENLCGTMTRPPKERKKESEVAQSCLPLCDPMDCSLPGTSVHGIFQARILGWVAISFSRGSSRPRDQTWVSRIVGRRFTVWATRLNTYFLMSP